MKNGAQASNAMSMENGKEPFNIWLLPAPMHQEATMDPVKALLNTSRTIMDMLPQTGKVIGPSNEQWYYFLYQKPIYFNL